MNRDPSSYPYEPEFSFKKVLFDRIDDIRYILSFKLRLFIAGLIGIGLGCLYAWQKPVTYTARLTFVIDDSKSGGAGGLAALAGEFGFNLDGIGGASGVLAGDNVQELLKSRKLIQSTLLTPYDDKGFNSLADVYARVNKLDQKWLKYSPDGKVIRFPVAEKVPFNRLQDSLMHEMTEDIIEGEFGIAKTDKKLGFFEVNATMKDERLAQLFCTRMIKTATDFFISTKTSRLRNNVVRLQYRADSIGRILNRKTYSSSSANQSLLDVNPAYTGVNASVEVKERDKILVSQIYTETVKNLEVSKTMLSQETPTVQIVDEPELPLKKNRLKYLKASVIGAFLIVLFYSFYLLLSRENKAPGKPAGEI